MKGISKDSCGDPVQTGAGRFSSLGARGRGGGEVGGTQMKLRALFPAVAFLSLFMLFGLAGSTFLSLSPVSPVHAQSGAPVFPEADADEDYTRDVDENTKPYDANKDYVMIGDPITATGSGIIYSIENARTAHFGINSYTGHLLVGSPLDYETKSTYTVTVIAKNTSGTAKQGVTINVNDVEESGKVTLSWTKNSSSELVFKADVSDPDGNVTVTGWDWYKSNSYNGDWDNPISTATSNTHNITPGTDAKYLKVTATYTDRKGSSKTATATLRRPVKTHGKTLEFNANSDQGYVCGEPPDPPVRITSFCVFVHRYQTPGTRIYYPAGVSYSDDSYPNPGEISYSLAGRNAGSFSIEPSSKELIATELNGYNAPGSDDKYEVKITATDLAGQAATITIQATPSGGSNNPIVQGPAVIRYPENGTWQLATYTGKFHDRPLNQDVGWIIGVQPGGGDGDFFDIDDDGVLSFTQPPDFEQGQKEYSFSLHVYDTNPPGRGRPGQTFYSVKVIVEDVNDPPEIVGPTDVDFPENSTAAVAEYTVEGVDAGETAHWKLEDGDDASNFSITKTGDDFAELRLKSPPDYESFDTDAEEHVFLLTIMVEVGQAMKTEHVRVEVTDVNEPPEFDEGNSATRNIAEDAQAGDAIGDPVEATDPEEDGLRYTLSGTDAASFDIDLYSGQLRVNAALDFETQTSYTVTVSVDDGEDADGNTDTTADDTITVTISVTGANDPPAFADTTATRDIGENTGAGIDIGAPIEATDPENNTLAYTLEGDDKDSFTIDGASGQLKTKAGVVYDFEATKNSYSVTVKADDGNGGTDTIAVTINVTDVNEAPMFDDGATATRSVAENTGAAHSVGAPVAATDPEADTLTYSSSGTDAAIFDINTTTGQLQTKAALDFETKSTYTFTVSVRDSKDSSGTADTAADNTTTVTINVDNVDEDGTVTLSPTQPQVDTALTATLTDLDGAVSVTAWQWARADTSTGTFADIVGGTAASYTPVADDLTKYLRATATYTDPQGSGKSADAVADNAVDPAPLINTDPAFSADTATRSVAENTEAGENIGLPVTATDDNTGDTLTYTLGGIDAADFAIDAASGQITVGASTTLDHETKPTYTVTVSVRDSEDSNGEPDTIEDDTITVTINVTDVDEDGTVTLSSDTPQIGTPLTATLTDPDGTVSGETWQWAKADSATGAFADIANATAESYTPADDDLSKFLKATVSYTDGEDSGKSAYKVSANPVNAAPEFSEENATRSVDENTEAGHAIGTPVTATDATTVTYTLGGTDAASFSIVDPARASCRPRRSWTSRARVPMR